MRILIGFYRWVLLQRPVSQSFIYWLQIHCISVLVMEKKISTMQLTSLHLTSPFQDLKSGKRSYTNLQPGKKLRGEPDSRAGCWAHCSFSTPEVLNLLNILSTLCKTLGQLPVFSPSRISSYIFAHKLWLDWNLTTLLSKQLSWKPVLTL